jgi:6-phosphogluconolactonase
MAQLKPHPQNLKVFGSIDDLLLAAAKDFAKRAIKKVQRTGSFKVALSGGNTPKLLFDILASGTNLGIKTPIPWEDIYVFWSDERYVPQNDEQSNYLMANAHLLSKVPIPKKNIFPISTGSGKPEQDALKYAETIKEVFQAKPSQVPVFDLVYLGMGPDGHTASLFPGTDVVKSLVIGNYPRQLVSALWVEKFKMYRISFLPDLINQAKAIILLVAGSDKAPTLNSVVCGKYQPEIYPVQLIEGQNGEKIWYVDKAAVAMLDNI